MTTPESLQAEIQEGLYRLLEHSKYILQNSNQQQLEDLTHNLDTKKLSSIWSERTAAEIIRTAAYLKFEETKTK